MTQSERLLRFLRANPGATTMQIQLGCEPFISNPRARISDLRAAGYVIDPIHRSDGYTGFVVREQPEQRELGLSA